MNQIDNVLCIESLIAATQKSMSRSRTPAHGLISDATPHLTDSGREVLLSVCSMLQQLMAHTDAAAAQGDKVEVWMPEAATLFGRYFATVRLAIVLTLVFAGRALGGLFMSSPDHDFSQAESLYQQVALQLG